MNICLSAEQGGLFTAKVFTIENCSSN